MADNIPEGLDDLLNSIRGEGKSQKSSAIVVVPKSQRSGSDSIADEDIDPVILRLLGLEDVVDIDYDTYRTLLKEANIKYGVVGKDKIPTEELMLLQEEIKRIRGKTGRFKVKGQKIKKESFVGKKKSSGISIVKGALPGAVRAKDVRPVTPEPVTPETKAVGDPLALISDKISKVSDNVKEAVEFFAKSEKQKKKVANKERVAKDAATKQEKENKAEGIRTRTRIPSILKKAIAPVKNIFDNMAELFQKIAVGTLVMELIRFLENPIEYFRPIVDWGNGMIGKINDFTKKFLSDHLGKINEIISFFNGEIEKLQNALNHVVGLIPGNIIPKFDLGKIPQIPIDKVTSSLTIPSIPFPKAKISQGGSSTPTGTESTTTTGLSSPQSTALGYIKKYESAGSGGYDAMNQGTVPDKTGAAPKSGDSKNILGQGITDMTIGEVIRRQDKNLTNAEGFIHAAGAYQFTGNTLPGLVQRSGLKMTDKFSPQNQDRLAVQLASERGAQPWLADPRNKLQYDQKALDAINALKGKNPKLSSAPPASKVQLSTSSTTSKTAPPPPKKPRMGITPVPISPQSNGGATSGSNANQKQIPIFSATDGTNQTTLSVKSLYNIVE